MADKKLINVDAATTMTNIYGNNGSKDVQVSLADAASVLAEANGIYMESGTGIKATCSTNFDTNSFPSANGFRIRFDDGDTAGVGFDLFFVYGGGLWYRTEHGGGWKEVANK